MALRAFQANPSIGGFGDEDGSQLCYANTSEPSKKDSNKEQSLLSADSNNRTQRKQSSSDFRQLGNESCDAFVQIVKELVDNAVDACARENEHSSSSPPRVLSKRVRVEIKPTQIPIDNDDGENDGNTATMDCLRVKISDNGCGMEDVDNCVSAFRSSKNGADTDNSGTKRSSPLRQDSSEKIKTNANLSKSERKHKSIISRSRANEHDSTPFTSGRYGVGLTLCLLHAQRLVPNSVTLIITSSKTLDYWIIRRYRADTQKDEIVCLKEERLPKVDNEECGTIVEVLVPGGQGAINSWPRLAEYFARFQLSIDLPCSIEVQAESLQPLPLYIKPPKELLCNLYGKKAKSSADNCIVNETKYNNLNDEVDVAWSDGFGDDETEVESMSYQKVSKSSRERAHLEDEKKNKVSLMKTAASLYKDRVDLRDINVAYSTQFIRHKNECGNSSTKAIHGPVLEMGMIVFGPRATKVDDESVQSDHDKYSTHSQKNREAKLQVVRLVNGVPVLDSCEALACGVITKISKSTVVWNSFGLDISDRSQLSSSTPSFGISDSAQVAPFLKSSTHSLYSLQNQNDILSSSDDDYDLEDIHNVRKRKKDQQARCILPAAQRLGDVLIVVQIRAKPSALPLPTLSKGRLPMNDKRINDALENAMADCLRSLQSKNSLLLTAHRLKKIERDVKYSPLVAGALAAVLGRAKRKNLYRNTLRVASCWDDEVKALGKSFERNAFDCERMKSSSTDDNDTDERAKSMMLRPLIERRIRFVVSTEFKEYQKAQENEYKRQQREEMAAERKKARASEATEFDGLDSDLCSDEEIVREIASHSTKPTGITNDENKVACFSDGFQSECSSSDDSRVEPIVHKVSNNEVEDDESWSSEFGECVDGTFFR